MKRRSVVVGIGVLACVLFCGEASAVVITWDLSQDLATGAQTWQMTKVGDGYGDAGSGDFNPPVNAGIQADGSARFVDTGNHGNDGFVMKNTAGTPIGQTWSIDMIVRGETAVNATGRSMGIRAGNSGATKSAGVGIEPGVVWNPNMPEVTGGNSLWMTCRNGAYVPHGALFVRTNEADGEGWRAVRITSNGDATVTLYDFVNGDPTQVGTVPTGGNWTELPAGAGGELDALGFHLNSLSGGTVLSSGFSLMGLAMSTDEALDGTTPFMLPPIVPEPASLMLLLVGLVPVLRRR